MPPKKKKAVKKKPAQKGKGKKECKCQTGGWGAPLSISEIAGYLKKRQKGGSAFSNVKLGKPIGINPNIRLQVQRGMGTVPAGLRSLDMSKVPPSARRFFYL